MYLSAGFSGLHVRETEQGQGDHQKTYRADRAGDQRK